MPSPHGQPLRDRTSSDRAPSDRAPTNRTPGNRASSNRAPGDRISGNRAPADRISSDRAPSDRISSDRTRSDRAPSNRAPTDRTPSHRRPADRRRERGAAGEQLAAEHLRRRGYEVLARNVRLPGGEIDAIARDGRALVIVEVKTRVAWRADGASDGFSPFDSIGPLKRARLRRLAGEWLRTTPMPRPHTSDIRFDAIGVTLHRSGRLLALEHIEGA